MALPVSVGEIIDLVDRGVKLYDKIRHEVPDLIAEVADRIESLQLYLKRLQAYLHNEKVLTDVRSAEKNDLENILAKTKTEVSKVIKILEKWKANEGPAGFEFRFKFIAQALFALGSSPKELEDLGKKLDQRQNEIRDWMQLLLLLGQTEILTVSKSQNQAASSNGRSDYNIMFIDPYNMGRSVVAEAWALLCREWTVRTDGQWRINYIHSAGLKVKSRSNVAPLLQQMDISMVPGNRPPAAVALSALFDGLPFNYSYKHEIKNRLSQRRSRGLTEDLFATYDFILVFNRHNLATLENLRDALAKRHEQPASSGKGRIMLLGEYGTTGSKEIFDAQKGPDGRENIDNWLGTVSNIKTSFQGFLKRELNWTQPAAGTPQKV